MKTIAAGLTFLLVFLITDSYADPGHRHAHCVKDYWGNCQAPARPYGYQNWHCAKDFWGNCAGGQQHWRQGRRHHHQRHQRDDDDNDNNRHRSGRDGIDRGAFCHPRRRVVGEEKTSKAKARRAADDAWMGAVRYDYGERFQDLNHAKDARHNCDPSSTSSILKRVHFRCVVEATPCRAPTGSVQERVERRYEEEEDDDEDAPRKKR